MTETDTSPSLNLVLIGMPGSGKTTLGRRFAIRHGLAFVDTDTLIERRHGKSLQELVNEGGPDALLAAEESALLALDRRGAVIATGGSAIYSDAGMRALGRNGFRVFLDVPLAELRQRLGDTAERGLLIRRGQGLDALYRERLPLYRRHADISIDCGGLDEDEALRTLESRVVPRLFG